MLPKESPLEQDSTLRLRLHSPLGLYPAHPLNVRGGRLFFNDDIMFSVVDVQPKEDHGLTEEQYSELEFLSLEEIRFFAALSISLRPDAGMLYTYPLPPYINVDADAASDDELFALAMDHARGTMLGINRPSGMSLPPICGGDKFHHREDPLDEALLEKLMSAIALNDHLLMRGLGALINAQMLFQRQEFCEAATMMLFVTLEASFQQVCRRLKENGLQNPTAADAGKYLEGVLGSAIYDEPEGYFVEWYEARIKSIHPSSRFGIFAFPPLQADDFYFLRDAMIVVYAFLIVGHKWAGLWRATHRSAS